MASSSHFGSDAEVPLLNDTVDSTVDYKGRPILRSISGGFIIVVEVVEKFAYGGIGANLISYLIGPLGQSTGMAAVNVNAWDGMRSLLPLLGAFLADYFFGRYHTIVLASLLYILGLGLLTLSVILPSLTASECLTDDIVSSPPKLQVMLFFFSLYLVAVAQGGHRPCVQAFGADQLDEQDPEECKAKSSFFNWWYFGVCAGGFVTTLIISYIQENLSWGLGFGIPCMVMAVALVVFLLGSTSYRYSIVKENKSVFLRISRVFVAAFRNRRTTSSTIVAEEESHGTLPREGSAQFK